MNVNVNGNNEYDIQVSLEFHSGKDAENTSIFFLASKAGLKVEDSFHYFIKTQNVKHGL